MRSKTGKEKNFDPCQQSVKANRYSIFWALSFFDRKKRNEVVDGEERAPG